PMEPWSVETGAARGASRPGLPEPVQLSGATEPVWARPGRPACRRRQGPWVGGIDGAKAQLDRALRPSGARWAVPHEARGVATRVERCPGLPPTLRGRDATG